MTAKNVQKKCRPPLASLAPGGERRACGAPMLCLVACRDYNQNIQNNMAVREFLMLCRLYEYIICDLF
jgi:hypothetical protein